MTRATATATLAVVVAVAVIAFFDWVPTPLNRNIEGAGTRERLIGTLIHITAGEIKPETNLSEYARNTRVLPSLGRSPIVPDIQHTLIHVAVLAACIFQWRAFLAK